MEQLRGPHYPMSTELNEIKSILACKADAEESSIFSKLKKLQSRAVLFPVLMLLLFFTLQVSVKSPFFV